MSQSSEAVKVIVRCRPVNEREERLHCEVCLESNLSVRRLLRDAALISLASSHAHALVLVHK